ncbi:MAG: flagellar protein FlaG [Treponema sp.]|nr:flagellar protein FlaG [Treponema sp.]
MNTITNSSMVQMAMDGQTLYKNNVKSVNTSKDQQVQTQSIAPSGAQVAQSIEQSVAQTKEVSQQLQRLSELISDNKLQFSVNKELGSVIVSIVDASTDKVIKQIPSEEIQNLKLRIRKAIGNIFDEVI